MADTQTAPRMTPAHVDAISTEGYGGESEERIALLREVKNFLRSQVSGDSVSVPPVYGEIAAERERQDAQWGGAENDDRNSPDDWRAYRTKYEQRALWNPHDLPTTRADLVKLAALTVAQIESIDRASSLASAGKEKAKARRKG